MTEHRVFFFSSSSFLLLLLLLPPLFLLLLLPLFLPGEAFKYDRPKLNVGSRAGALFSAYLNPYRCPLVNDLNVLGRSLLHYYLHSAPTGIHFYGPLCFSCVYPVVLQAHHIVAQRLGEVAVVPLHVTDTVTPHAPKVIGREPVSHGPPLFLRASAICRSRTIFVRSSSAALADGPSTMLVGTNP